MSDLNKILVVGPSWVGDMTMAQSLFIRLRENHPDAVIDVLAPAWSVDLLGRMPEVHKAYTLNATHGELAIRKRWRLAKQLKDNRYTRSIVLPRSFKSALIPFWAGIPVRTGFSAELRYGLINDLRKLDANLDQTVKRYVALADEQAPDSKAIQCPQPRLRIDKQNAQLVLNRLGLATDKPIIGLMPGAEYGPSKQWPIEYHTLLAEQLVKKGCYVWLFGSQKEEMLGRSIASANTEAIINLCGRTSLVDVVDLIAQLSAVVANDSGLMHIASAVDVPVVAIYGSTSPAFAPPLTNKAVIKFTDVECSPCRKRVCPYDHYRCLREITVEEIHNALSDLTHS